MKDFAIVIGWIYLIMITTWLFYLALMNIKRNWKKISWPVRILAAVPIAIVGIIIDVVMNLVVGTLFFVELPHEWVFTDRVKRHKAESWNWRNRLAHWFCNNILDPFDPDHDGHC